MPITETRRRYNEKHKEETAEYMRRHNQANKERLHEQQRQYREAHKEETAKYDKQYHLDHPERTRSDRRKRRALETDADGHFTEEEFTLLCEASENKCIYCHLELPLVPDHATPLSRGGSNSINNIVPACQSCNSKKGTKTYDEYIESLRRTS